MLSKLRWAQLLPFIIFAALMAFLWRGLSLKPHDLPSTLIDKPFPNFYLDSLLHPTEHLTTDNIKGKVALVNIWASWCGACRNEHKQLMKIARESHIPIYGINYRDTPAAAKQWLKKYGDPYSLIISDPAGKLGIDLGVYGVPETFIIDAQGVIRYKQLGRLTMKQWRDDLLPVINKVRA